MLDDKKRAEFDQVAAVRHREKTCRNCRFYDSAMTCSVGTPKTAAIRLDYIHPPRLPDCSCNKFRPMPDQFTLQIRRDFDGDRG